MPVVMAALGASALYPFHFACTFASGREREVMQARRVLLSFTFCFVSLAVTTGAYAWTEDFNGSFSQAWNASSGTFPNENIWTFGDYGNVGTVMYSGNAPTGSFGTIGADQVYRMTTSQGPLDRSAMASDDVFSGTEGYVEARFNTVTQDSQHIDQFVDLWLLNATDPTKYVRVGLFGSDFSTNRGWSLASSTDGSAFFGGVNYANNTWYRARIVASATDLRVSIFNDAGNVE